MGEKKIAEYPSGLLMVPPATQLGRSLPSAGGSNKEPRTPINLLPTGGRGPRGARGGGHGVLLTGLGGGRRPAGPARTPGIPLSRALSGPIKIINFSCGALEKQTRERIPVIYNLAVLSLNAAIRTGLSCCRR